MDPMTSSTNAANWLRDALLQDPRDAERAASSLLDAREDREAAEALQAAPLEVTQFATLAYREGRKEVRAAVEEVLGRAETIRCEEVHRALRGAADDLLDFDVRVHPTPDGPQPFPTYGNTLAGRLLLRAREYGRRMADVAGR